MLNVTKYMCTVETKNYPVSSIVPIINRYSSIRKKLNVSEIANCLASYATVTLHKNNGANVRLTKDNFKTILLNYKNEISQQKLNNSMVTENKKNEKAIEEMKKESVKTTETKKVEQETVVQKIQKSVVASKESTNNVTPVTKKVEPIVNTNDKKEETKTNTDKK